MGQACCVSEKTANLETGAAGQLSEIKVIAPDAFDDDGMEKPRNVAAPPVAMPSTSVEIEFKLDSGEIKSATFNCRPIGLSYDHLVPLVVSEIATGGQAEKMGIQTGWEIKSIGGMSFAGLDLGESLMMVEKNVRVLPVKGASS